MNDDGTDAARGPRGGIPMMVTRASLRSVALVFFLVAGCSGKTVGPADAPASSSSSSPPGAGAGGALPPDIVELGGTGPAYPGSGFRVHEWGTNTVVVGS